jgi:predicted DNA-binding transcriptional regulator AlpA
LFGCGSGVQRGQTFTKKLRSDHDLPRTLRQKQAAAYVGMSESGFIKLMRKGQGPRQIIKDRAVYFKTEHLDAWMLADLVPEDAVIEITLQERRKAQFHKSRARKALGYDA